MNELTDRERDAMVFARAAKGKKLALDGWQKIRQGRAVWAKDGEYLDVNGRPCDPPTEPPVSMIKQAIAKVEAMSADELADFVKGKIRKPRKKVEPIKTEVAEPETVADPEPEAVTDPEPPEAA